jgi:hypothetical protein
VGSNWFNLPTTLSALTIGSVTNAAYVYANTALTVQGPVTLQGGYIEVSQPISAAGDILLDGDTGAGITVEHPRRLFQRHGQHHGRFER